MPDALRLIAVSRFGLRKSELLSLLMRIGYVGRAEVSEFDWLLFREVLGDSIYEGSGGLLNFSHPHLRDCIEYILFGKLSVFSGSPYLFGSVSKIHLCCSRYVVHFSVCTVGEML